MIALLDKINAGIEFVMPFSLIAIFCFSLSIAIIFAGFVYTQKGRILTDAAWLISGSITILMVGLGIQYDPTPTKVLNVISQTHDFRQDLGHEAKYIQIKWCGNISDAPVFIGNEDNKRKICDIARSASDWSVAIGFKLMGSYNWEEYPLYPKYDYVNYPPFPTYSDTLIIADYERFLKDRLARYNGYAIYIRNKTSEIRKAIVIKLLRLIFLNIAACAAAFRFGRAIFELKQLKQSEKTSV